MCFYGLILYLLTDTTHGVSSEILSAGSPDSGFIKHTAHFNGTGLPSQQNRSDNAFRFTRGILHGPEEQSRTRVTCVGKSIGVTDQPQCTTLYYTTAHPSRVPEPTQCGAGLAVWVLVPKCLF